MLQLAKTEWRPYRISLCLSYTCMQIFHYFKIKRNTHPPTHTLTNTVRSHYTSTRMTKMKKTENIKHWKGYGATGTHIHYCWECWLVQTLWKKCLAVSTKAGNTHTLWPSLSIFWQQESTHMRCSEAVHFMITLNWKLSNAHQQYDSWVSCNIYLLSQSLWAAIRKYHKLGDLSKTHLFLTILETEKSKVKVSLDVVSGEGPLPGLQMAVFLCLHMAFPCAHMRRGGERGRERERSCLFLFF